MREDRIGAIKVQAQKTAHNDGNKADWTGRGSWRCVNPVVEVRIGYATAS